MKQTIAEKGLESAQMVVCFVLGVVLFAVSLSGSLVLAVLILLSFPVKAAAFILDVACGGVAWIVGFCEDLMS